MTLDVTTHCLCVDDAIYRVFVPRDLGSLSATPDLKSQIPTVCAHIWPSGEIACDVDIKWWEFVQF